MALQLNRLNAILFRHHFTIFSKLPPSFRQQSDKSSTFEVDVLDDFTSQLVEKKIYKWGSNIKTKNRNSKNVEKPQSNFVDTQENNIKNLSTEQISALFQNAIDRGDNNYTINLMKQCINCGKCPSLSILIHVLSFCSHSGDKETILKIQQLCGRCRPEILKSNSDFKHYVAEATWIKGNIPKSLELFENVYRNNVFLRRRIRLTLKYLILDVVSTRSEAVLLNLIKFSESLLRDFKDFFPLACVWQACFLSEWFTDQTLALELLERNEGLFKAVVNRIPFVVFVSLNSHRTEAVYRLLELLLKYEMKEQYTSVLVALLDYQFQRGDLQSCSEIIEWSVDNDVELPSIQHIILINLLLNEKLKTPLAKLKPKSTIKPEYNLKF